MLCKFSGKIHGSIFYEKAMRYGKLSSSQETIYGNCKEKIAEAKEKLVYERLMQQPIKASAENGNLRNIYAGPALVEEVY